MRGLYCSLAILLYTVAHWIRRDLPQIITGTIRIAKNTARHPMQTKRSYMPKAFNQGVAADMIAVTQMLGTNATPIGAFRKNTV